MKSDGDPAQSRSRQEKVAQGRSRERRKAAPPLQQGFGKKCRHPLRRCPAGTSMAPPCWIRATRARGPERVRGWPVDYGLAADICPQARLRCASLSTELPYHTHRNEPTNLLDRPPRLVVAAVARVVTAEISDDVEMSSRLWQYPSEAGEVCRPNRRRLRQSFRATVAAWPRVRKEARRQAGWDADSNILDLQQTVQSRESPWQRNESCAKSPSRVTRGRSNVVACRVLAACRSRPPLAHPMRRACMSHRLPLRIGRHHFAATSFSEHIGASPSG
jgi:hypothetical protein